MARWTSTFDGRVVKDPEEYTFESGGSQVTLSVAVNHRKKSDTDPSGYEDDGVDFIDVKASGEYGAALKAYRKGNIVKVTDAVTKSRTYQKKDGGEGRA